MMKQEGLLPDFLVQHISDHQHLTTEEEQELATIIQNPESTEQQRIECRNKLAIANLRFAMTVIRGYETNGLSIEYEDLFQHAFEGLIDAANTFKPGHGKFCTYAYYCIKNRTSPAIQQNLYCVKISGTTQKKVECVLSFANEMSHIDQRYVDPLAVADQCGFSIDEIESGLNATGYQSVDETELACYDTTEDDVALKSQMAEVVSILSPFEYDLLARSYGLGGGEPQTSQKIGDYYAVSGQRIRVLINNAIEKLADNMNPRRDTDGSKRESNSS